MDKETVRKQIDRIWELNQWVTELWETLPSDEAIQAVEERRRGAESTTASASESRPAWIIKCCSSDDSQE